MTLIDSSIHREWLVAASRPAPEQVAHLVCELFTRLNVTDIVREHKFHLPVTQTELGEALGLSAVHVNRTLMKLEQDGLITRSKRMITIADWKKLVKVADFQPRYLHLDRQNFQTPHRDMLEPA